VINVAEMGIKKVLGSGKVTKKDQYLRTCVL